MAKGQKFFFAEITDMYGGERNYSWVTRHKVRAVSRHGALCKLSSDSGLNFSHEYSDFYVSASGATGLERRR